MTDTISGLPFWEIRFDADGDPGQEAATAIDEIGTLGITDLVVFSHGWNNSPDTARRLYDGWFGELAPQLTHVTTSRPVHVGLVGVFWPSQRWSDEPIPDFQPSVRPRAADSGAAGVRARPEPGVAASPTIDDVTLQGLKHLFPKGDAQLDRMAALLAQPPTSAAAEEFLQQMQDFSNATAVASDDEPGMLRDEAKPLFDRYLAALRDSGVAIAPDAGGEAGLADSLGGIWHGAKEALRQLTYYQMKNRAGVVGEHGLGPFVGRLAAGAPAIRVHLVGHSFGARVVSYALAGLPPALDPSPVKSVTLLEGAFSHFAFAAELPFDVKRAGGLAGRMQRIDGPLVVCFSSHDDAVGTFYPLASIAAGEDSAAADDRFYRWGGMGHDGAQAVQAKLDVLQPATIDANYRFAPGQALNVDASETVCRGGPPSGAHSDIVHPELTWVVLKAGGIVP